MNLQKINLENLTEEERTELIRLVEKAKKPRNKMWKPEDGRIYYTAYGDIVQAYHWDNDKIDNSRYAVGNVFPTEREAEIAIEKLKIKVELQRYADAHNEGEIDWQDDEQEKWFIFYEYHCKEIIYESYFFARDPFQVYFTSEEVARAAVRKIGEERIKRYLFEVKE